jgi:hypothetical protein
MTTQHHREQDHRGVEDCSTVVLDRPIGRYAAGTHVCDVLDGLIQRSIDVRNHYHSGFFAFRTDAYIAPYDPQGSLNGFMLIDAQIRDVSTGALTLDAILAEPIPQEKVAHFGADAWFVELYNDAITVLMQDVSPEDTVIYVDSSAGFPDVPFLIQIGTETMWVIAVNGNEWTVVRDDPQSHLAGSYVVVC